MRSDWPNALKTMLQGNEITRCFLIELVSRNQQTVRLCDYSSGVTVGGNLFVHDPGFNITQIRLQAGGTPPQVDMQLPITDLGPIYAEDIRRGVWRGGEMRVWLADYNNADNARGSLIDGFVGNVQFTDELITYIEALSRGDSTDNIILPRIQPKCRHVFGDYYCGFDVSTVTLDGNVDSVVSNSVFTITVSNPDGLDFNGGAVRAESGNNAGISVDVRKWTPGSSLIELWDPFPLDMVSSDVISVHAGCQKTRAACAAYGQINHYGGYDYVPGQNYGGV